MAKISLVCPIEKRDEKTVVLSPSVGLVKLLIEDRQPLMGGQAIFELWRLNTCFVAHLPQEISGIALKLNNEKQFFVEFRSEVLALEALNANLLKEKTQKVRQAEKEGQAITSPMDGMFYLRPTPTDAPFVTIGQEIQPGQTIGLIEVMKSFYPLKYQGLRPAKVMAILIENASPVTSGSRIFEVKVG